MVVAAAAAAVAVVMVAVVVMVVICEVCSSLSALTLSVGWSVQILTSNIQKILLLQNYGT